MASVDNVNIDNSPDVIPLQAGQSLPQQPIVARTVGTISTIAGLPGPDILIATGAATKGLSIVTAPVGSTITFSISGVTTAIKESGGTTLDIGAVADGQFLKRVGATIVGAAAGGGTNETLLQSTVLDLNTSTKQTLYTVPGGKSAVITKIVARSPSVDLSTGVTARLSFGFNAGATNWTSGVQMGTTLLTAATLFQVFSQEFAASSGASTIGTATQTFGAITDAAFGSAATVVIDVFGYEF